MGPLTRAHLRPRRRRRLRAAVAAGVLLLFVLGAAGPAWAAGAKGPHRIIFDLAAEPSWNHEFFSPGAWTDSAEDVVMAKGGVTYVTGTMFNAAGNPDLSLMKLVDGVPAWPAPKLYDGPYHGTETGRDIALGPGNAIYTAGVSTGASGMLDILVVKWSSAGVVKWARRYDGPAHGMDIATSIAVDSAGNVIVGGEAGNVGGGDWVVVSWSSSGAKRWTSRYGSSAAHEMAPLSLVVAKDRSVYACGVRAVIPDAAAMIVRYSRSGKVLWKKTYKGPSGINAIVWAGVARPGGGVYVCGTTTSTATDADGLVMSYTPKGARKVFALDTGPGGATEQEFNDLAVTSTGQVVAAGSTRSAGNRDCRAVSYTVDGTIAGQFTLPGAWEDEFAAVATDSFGGFYATGTYYTAFNKTAILTVRGSVLNGGGGFSSLWAPAFVSIENEPNAIAVRGSTACVVGRCSEGPLHGVDQFVLGYVY